MGKFLEAEKKRQTDLLATSPYFTEQARVGGVYKNKIRPFCLPRDLAEENLFPGIRGAITAYFDEKEIKWHDGQNRRPSNHLCDSQVCCANFLFPFADKPQALAELLRPLFPTIRDVISMECVKDVKSQSVAFEWIGLHNYLGEKISRNGKRTRGANFTSADAAVRFERTDGLRQSVLIEWKYTETYGGAFLKVARSGTDRTKIYERLYGKADCPIDKGKLPGFDSLFYEPFYQLMRQQFLAHEMETTRELGADVVSLLHIAPEHNSDFLRITSPALRPLGGSVTEVWRRLLRQPDRFTSVNTETLFGQFPAERFPDLAPWWDYIAARYPWAH